MATKRVAVTGASGFVGRYIVRELIARQDVELVTASRGVPPPKDAPERSRHVLLDIGTVDPVDAFTRLGEPDILIHLAWSGLPHYTSLHHIDQLAQQYAFLKGLVNAGLSSLTCVGTCFEYGMQSGELSEEMHAQPRNPYGFAKDALRRELEFLRGQHHFALNWGRLFYMFGPGQPPSSIYTQFTTAGTRGDTSFRMSGGEQLRDFLPVAEVARFVVLLALRAQDSGTVNVCSGRPVSVRTLVEGWRSDFGWNIELDFGHYPYPDYEPMAFWGARLKLDSVLKDLGEAEVRTKPGADSA